MDKQKAIRKITAMALVLSLTVPAVVSPLVVDSPAVGTASASHKCEISDSAVLALVNSLSKLETGQDCTLWHGGKVNTTGLDANQTRVRAYQSGIDTRATIDVIQTSYDNYLTDTKSIALMEGKNAYIRALENGSTKQGAVIDAKQAVQDYYAVKQANLVKAWNASFQRAERIADLGYTESALSQHELLKTKTSSSADPITRSGSKPNGGANYAGLWSIKNGVDFGTSSINLVNQTDVKTRTATIGTKGSSSASRTMHTVKPSTGVVSDPSYSSISASGIMLRDPIPGNSNFGDKLYLDFTAFAQKWNKIQTQTISVGSQVETFVNGTYDKWDAGLISTDDLVDPYVGARDYSPSGNFQAWSLSSLSSLGLNSPENLDQTGSMNVTDETTGITYQGILMTDENPANNTFGVNKTYNARNLNGKQWVVTEDSNQELTGNFTVQSITNKKGESLDKIGYRDLNYATSNLTEYRRLSEELKEIDKKIEAREQKLRNEGSSVIPDSIGGFDLQTVLLAVFALVVAGVVARFTGN